MDNIFTDDFNNQPNSTDSDFPAIAPRRAKVSGLISILHAFMAASSAIIGTGVPL